MSLYLYNSNWFKKNVSPQKRQKDFYHSIDNPFNKNKLTSLRHLNHKILREFFYLLKEKGFKNTSRARIYSTLKQFFDYELKQKNIRKIL